MKYLKMKPIQYIVVGAIIAVIPFLFHIPQATMTILNTVVIYSMIALGFNILLGYAGQISLGHAAFMGLGAYVSAYLTTKLALPFLLSLLISGIVPMIIGVLLGLIALRLEGHYLGIATLGFGVAAQQIFVEWVGFTNGYSGVRAKYPAIFGYQFKSREAFFVLAIAVLVILCIFAYNLLKAKTGRAILAMRDSASAAQAMGVYIYKYKLIAFALSAFYAGIAGSMYIHLIRFTEPSTWGVTLSLNLLAIVVIGGMASIGGSILGAIFIGLSPEVIKAIPALSEIMNLSYILNGVTMILAIMFFPLGFVRLPVQWKLYRAKRKKNKALKLGLEDQA